MDRHENGREPAPDEKELLLTLSPDSTLLVILRALYGLMLDYGVYLTDRGDALAFSKGQLEQMILLGQHGQSDTPVRDLPHLMEDGLFRPLQLEDTDGFENVSALVLERRGARVTSLARAVNPNELDFPEWWEAPIPFALCGRGKLKLNPAALLMFGPELERLNAVALPEKDEFIVELEGKGKPCFLAFSRLEPNVFTIDDCTGDLVEAQDISWWAAVGRACTKEIEKRGQSWRRADSVPENFDGKAWPCEWQGRFLGYLCVEDAAPQAAEPDAGDDEHKKPRKPRKAPAKKRPPRQEAEEEDGSRKDDEVLKALGPQTMALLAAGQSRDDSFEDEPAEPAPVRKRRGAGSAGRAKKAAG